MEKGAIYNITSKKLKMSHHHKNIAGWTFTSMSIRDAPYFPPLEHYGLFWTYRPIKDGYAHSNMYIFHF